MSKSKLPAKLQPWADARSRFRLSHAQVQMARELGLNPKKLGSLANHHQEPWKAPLPEYIEHLYEKQFGRSRPENVRSLEELVAARRRNKEEKKARKDEQATEPTP